MPLVRASDEPHGLERAAYYALLAFAAALPFSIFVSETLLTVTGVLWLVLILYRKEEFEVPPMFWPLAAYAGATLVSALFSIDPRVSFIDCKQLLLFSIVPIGYRLVPDGGRSRSSTSSSRLAPSAPRSASCSSAF